ncbi:MAG: calcium/sodium antiporter [Planctomycetes bacterium]|nr:calcium/sodium antiporter [Planctomycetota bacterium]
MPDLTDSYWNGVSTEMDILLNLLLFAVGLVILYYGAESTLNGSVRIAEAFGVSKLVIGLTLVAYGTSAPELTLDVTAALRGSTDLAFGDLIGSNIANLGLILAVGALIRPMQVEMKLLSAEVPIMIATALMTWSLAADGVLDRQDGLAMLACLALVVGYSFRSVTSESAAVKSDIEEAGSSTTSLKWSVVLVIVGLAGLVLGAQLMVLGATSLARSLGVSELLIGMTIVAVGTSLPELATTIVAARKGEADIAVGNVIGSNIINLLGVLACVATISNVQIATSSLSFELPFVTLMSLLLVPMMIRGQRITRGEGVVLLLMYLGFLIAQGVMHGGEVVAHI